MAFRAELHRPAHGYIFCAPGRKRAFDGWIQREPAEAEKAMLSARNTLKGTVKSVKFGQVMAEVVVSVGDREMVSLISRASAESLDLKEGDEVAAVVKATEVMIQKD